MITEGGGGGGGGGGRRRARRLLYLDGLLTRGTLYRRSRDAKVPQTVGATSQEGLGRGRREHGETGKKGECFCFTKI